MILLPLLILGLIGYGIIQLCGLILGAILARNHFKLTQEFKDPGDLMTRPKPLTAKELEGWDGENGLEIEEL